MITGWGEQGENSTYTTALQKVSTKVRDIGSHPRAMEHNVIMMVGVCFIYAVRVYVTYIRTL